MRKVTISDKDSGTTSPVSVDDLVVTINGEAASNDDLFIFMERVKFSKLRNITLNE
jgi:hypothetical protein